MSELELNEAFFVWCGLLFFILVWVFFARGWGQDIHKFNMHCITESLLVSPKKLKGQSLFLKLSVKSQNLLFIRTDVNIIPNQKIRTDKSNKAVQKMYDIL